MRELCLTHPFGPSERMKGHGHGLQAPFRRLFQSWGCHGIKEISLTWKEVGLEIKSKGSAEVGISLKKC